MKQPPSTPIACPQCRSENTVKNGRHTATNAQKMLCRACGRHFRTRYRHRARTAKAKRRITESLEVGASLRQTAIAAEVALSTVQRHRTHLQQRAVPHRASVPATPFSAILADPAWSFDNYAQQHDARTPQAHYDVMTVDAIAALPVEAVAADDCMLFLWAVSPRLPDAIRVGEAWGFTYKTVAFTWAKQVASAKDTPRKLPVAHPMHWHMGMGYYTRANPELCLLFTRGTPRRQSKAVRELIIAPVQAHSRKPDAIYERIEGLVSVPYLELFARQQRTGWTALGNEVDGQCLTHSLPQLARQFTE